MSFSLDLLLSLLHCVFCLIFFLLFLWHLSEQGFLPRCPVGMLLFYVTNKFDLIWNPINMVLECSLCVVYWNRIDDCVWCGVSWLFLFGCEHRCKWSTENSFIHIRLLINTITERIMYSERHVEYNKPCGRPPQYAPAHASSPLSFFILKVVFELRATWATSVPILFFLWHLCSRLRSDVRDRQTDRRQTRIIA